MKLVEFVTAGNPRELPPGVRPTLRRSFNANARDVGHATKCQVTMRQCCDIELLGRPPTTRRISPPPVALPSMPLGRSTAVGRIAAISIPEQRVLSSLGIKATSARTRRTAGVDSRTSGRLDTRKVQIPDFLQTPIASPAIPGSRNPGKSTDVDDDDVPDLTAKSMQNEKWSCSVGRPRKDGKPKT